MEVKAIAKNIRISPTKVRLVADLIRGMEAQKALDQLKFMKKMARFPVSKVLSSAIANGAHNYDMQKENLVIKEIRIDEGNKLYRWMPRAHGRATKLRKRSCHIVITLKEIVESKDWKPKIQKIEKPIKLGEAPKEKKIEKSLVKEIESLENASTDEKGKKIVDPRGEGKGKHTKIEGAGSKGFIGKVFRRKSG